MTSSMRNSLHRRNHKERSQLANRTRLGLLEKHADYVKRARDYHAKQARLNRLKQKVAERNKDEYYFSMKKQATKGGVHIHDRGNVALPVDIVKVLKTQDENYIRTIRLSGLKKIDRIKNQLTTMANLVGSADKSNNDGLDEQQVELLQDAGVIPRPNKRRRTNDLKPKHIVFVDNEAEALQYEKSVSKFDTAQLDQCANATSPDVIDLGWKLPKSTKKGKQKASPADAAVLKDIDDEDEDPESSLKLSTPSDRQRLLKELAARLARDKQLRYAQRELEMQRLMMGKGRRAKIRGMELVEGKEDDRDEDDEDALDARKGRSGKTVRRVVDEKLYKPRVYKWKMERK